MEISLEVPVRACDVGGWTDTWFAGHGRVCSLAVEPGVSVRAVAREGRGRVRLELVDYALAIEVGAEPGEHRLLVEAVHEAGVAVDLDVSLRIASAVPPGCSLGTSAAVVVGIVAALDAIGGHERPRADLAAAAHRVETERLGRQAGVQDQVAAAHGGASRIDVAPYPAAARHAIALSPATRQALDERLVHVAYGGPHDSSTVHEQVIEQLRVEGISSPRLESLRELAAHAGDALGAGDLEGYGATLTAATEAQRGLHAALVSREADGLIELATGHGASGWKVNGAGGLGGSLSVLARDAGAAAALRTDLVGRGERVLDLRLAAEGARVVDRSG
jgi:D-glycero-alpha-D-manno-heptose-7-phosphate kinase